MMRRLLPVLALVVLIPASAGSLPPAAAVNGATHITSSAVFVSATQEAFQGSSCSDTVFNDPRVNGYDAAILYVGDIAGQPRTLHITWQGETRLEAAIGGGLSGTFFNTSCAQPPDGPHAFPNPGGQPTPGVDWHFTVPAGDKWLIVQSAFLFNVTLTVSVS